MRKITLPILLLSSSLLFTPPPTPPNSQVSTYAQSAQPANVVDEGDEDYGLDTSNCNMQTVYAVSWVAVCASIAIWVKLQPCLLCLAEAAQPK